MKIPGRRRWSGRRLASATAWVGLWVAAAEALRIYYEVHGAGAPLVLVHGSCMTIDLNWSKLIPQLAGSRRVIALEMQGHGRTADSERPFSDESRMERP